MVSERRHLAELSGPVAAERLGERSILVQPLGAIEQHGPHLPLNTDLLVATAVAEAAVARVGEELDVWLLPPLAYTKSDEHAWAPGTIWLSATTLLAVVTDLGRSLTTTRARRLVLFNGHGGNSSLLSVALRELRRRFDLLTFLAHPSLPADRGGGSAPTELGMGVHGGSDETSMVLHLRPDLVDLGRAERNVPEALAANDHVRFGGSVAFGWLSNDFGPTGVIGDPTTATAERGAVLVEAAVAGFCAALAEVAAFDLPRRPAPG